MDSWVQIRLKVLEFEMMVYGYGHVIQVDMCIPVTAVVWTIWYVILECSVIIIENWFTIFGCGPIAFLRIRLGIGN